MFKTLRSLLKGAADKAAEKAQEPDIEDIIGEEGKRIRKSALDDVLEQLEMALLSADVALPVAEQIVGSVSEDLTGKRHQRGYGLNEIVEIALKTTLRELLSEHKFDFWRHVDENEVRPIVIMFVGVNGTGKTTVIAKLAHLLSRRGFTSVLAAGDTFRAGAIEQISIHAERLGTKLIKHQAGGDPAAVAYDAVEHAKARKRDFVLVDTAGRMQTNRNLMDEMKKIKRVAQPDMVIFVGDSLTGTDAIEQARQFNEAIGVDGIVLTKLDADAKGGAAISISHEIGKPIVFLCNGQEYDDILEFDPDWMVARIFEEE